MPATQVWVGHTRVMSRPPQTTGNVSVPTIPLQIFQRCSPILTQTLQRIRKHGVPASPRHTAAVAPPHTAPRLHLGCLRESNAQARGCASAPDARRAPPDPHRSGSARLGSCSVRLRSAPSWPAATHAGRSVSPPDGPPSCLQGLVLRRRDSRHAQSVRAKPLPRRTPIRTAS